MVLKIMSGAKNHIMSQMRLKPAKITSKYLPVKYHKIGKISHNVLKIIVKDKKIFAKITI